MSADKDVKTENWRTNMNVLENQMKKIQTAVDAYIQAMYHQKIASVDKFMAGEADVNLLRKTFSNEAKCRNVVKSVQEMVDRIVYDDACSDECIISLIADLRSTLEMMMDEVYEVRNLL